MNRNSCSRILFPAVCALLLLLLDPLAAEERTLTQKYEALFESWRLDAVALVQGEEKRLALNQRLEQERQALEGLRRQRDQLVRAEEQAQERWMSWMADPSKQVFDSQPHHADTVTSAIGRAAEALREDLQVESREVTVVSAQGDQGQQSVIVFGPSRAVLKRGSQPLLASLDGDRWWSGGPRLGHMPEGWGWIDLDGNTALQVHEDDGLAGWLQAGGPFLWIICGLGIWASLLIIWRTVAFLRQQVPLPILQQYLKAPQHQLQSSQWSTIVQQSGLAAPMLQAHQDGRGKTSEERLALLDASLTVAQRPLRRGMMMIGVIAAVAPLLGLLGTVDGMITTFADLAAAGNSDARNLSSGISVALLTTQAGLVVAVPVMMAHALLSRMADRRRSRLQEICDLLSGFSPPEVQQ